ncbi:hypothetical protein LCGC14_0829980 [marine sediment metagenome]|uniref:Metallo-beta-lactamase domain-containing protein n=1 Tax=marine sediment metagenome TaxID=412755 RepID=A0A0F9PL16_9ZZZZ|nr:MAG: Hydroxyacylglutathione hydrolase [Candidatus Lokiarchaeum sp. GC14_75]HEC37473.1 MBL fold metallo-hydrolase [bacterium]
MAYRRFETKWIYLVKTLSQKVFKIVYIKNEGKFNENTYLIDGIPLFGAQESVAVYAIENEGETMLIDTSFSLMARRIILKLKEFGIYPAQKILLTHSHFDHIQGVNRLKRLMKDVDIKVFASSNAIKHLKSPNFMNDPFEAKVKPFESAIPLNEGDTIDLNGLELKILNFFGHTMDSIAVFDKKNKNIFVGDAIMNKRKDYYQGTFMPPEFHEPELLTTFQKLRNINNQLDSISLSHYGVWTGKDFKQIVKDMEEVHFSTKNAIINWYNENPSLNYIAKKYIDTFTPNANRYRGKNIELLEGTMSWFLEGLRRSGII